MHQGTGYSLPARLELRQRQLAPEVAKWRKFEAERQEHARLQARVLSQQAGLLGRQSAELEGQVRWAWSLHVCSASLALQPCPA